MSGICNSFFGFSVVTNEEDVSAVHVSNVVVNIGEITMSWYFINTHLHLFKPLFHCSSETLESPHVGVVEVLQAYHLPC